MIKELHIAAQYLAAAAISFVEKKDDDSHTNLGWSNDSSTLFTRPLNSKGDKLALDLTSYSLVWYTLSGITASLGLDKISHQQVLKWINKQLKEADFDTDYNYEFHYDIGYGIDMETYSFPEADEPAIQKVSTLLSTAQNALSDSLNKENLSSEIRVWSHHFDIGAFAVVTDSLSLGIGLAIPDSKIDDFYYYISGYNGHDSLETKNFTVLSKGEWQTGDWKAGTLKASGVEEKTAINFFLETISIFRKNYEGAQK